MFKICAGIVENIGHLLRSQDFSAAHRVSPSKFSRKRCLNADILVAFLLQMVGGRSLQVGPDQFSCAVRGSATLARVVTRSSLSQLRKKLLPSALGAIGAQWVRRWWAAAGEHRWNGFRVAAADGTCVRVPSWRETQDAYGFGPNGDDSVVMARVGGLLVVASNQMVHSDGKHSLLVSAQVALSVGDLLVLDRGYPA